MILLYLVVAFVFFVWWIRGAFWPGAFLAFCSGLIILLATLMGDRGIATLAEGSGPIVVAGFFLSMAPWFIRTTIQKGREERMREALHGLRFNDPEGG
ncbi:hypothetical protein [Gluconobacter sp. Dm-44]|uniref:hypothetical protein n=1 Tax=Gluconobacter sp. Dm-44 TaxID=2799805 RepID=UPI001B8B5AB4|nr:hypothetical protein [Gluconobacter sp. Dm-44]MBS1060770.1 hypothetical protein [Gluconobacter sp. Dm-44]